MAGRFLIKKNDARTGTCNTGDVVYQFDAIGFEFGYSTDNVVNFYANVQRDSRRLYRSTSEMSMPALFGSTISR